VLLQSPRIGHGFNLSFFPSVEEQVKKQNICIEVCPLSNQILGYIEDLRMHPAHSWIRHGIPISISPDDQGLFGYTGVTPDFWSIFLAWELDLRDLKKLCMNSILYSSLTKKDKETALAVWERKWKNFIENFN
jgi:adenosine deaminase CECR1